MCTTQIYQLIFSRSALSWSLLGFLAVAHQSPLAIEKRATSASLTLALPGSPARGSPGSHQPPCSCFSKSLIILKFFTNKLEPCSSFCWSLQDTCSNDSLKLLNYWNRTCSCLIYEPNLYSYNTVGFIKGFLSYEPATNARHKEGHATNDSQSLHAHVPLTQIILMHSCLK